MNELLTYIETMSRDPAGEIVPRYAARGIYYILSKKHSDKSIEEVVKRALEWFVQPDTDVVEIFARRVWINCLTSFASVHDCVMTAGAIQTAICGFGIDEFNEAKMEEGASAFQTTIEERKALFERNRGATSFAVYSVGLYKTELEETIYGGHAFTLIQYPELSRDTLKVRYRIFQSYLHGYSLEEQVVQQRAASKRGDGSFSHKKCLQFIQRCHDFTEGRVWDNKLYQELFGTKVASCEGQSIMRPIPLRFFSKILLQKEASENIRKFSLIKEKLHEFYTLTTAPFTEYINLRGGTSYEPMVFMFDWYHAAD